MSIPPLFPRRCGAAEGINPGAGRDHQEAEELSHAEGAEDETQLHIGFPEEFDEETDGAVSDEVEGKQGAVEGAPSPDQPENGKEDDPFEEGLVELGGMAEQVQRSRGKTIPQATVVARP